MNTKRPLLHLALYHPAIPQNTGNIGRLCVGHRARLHLIAPGFDVDEKAVRRAGLDYWPHLDRRIHTDDDAFLTWLTEPAGNDHPPDHRPEPWLITKTGKLRFDQPDYRDGDVLILGNENTGLPPAWHERWPERRVHIPIHGPIRSYNLANAAAITLAHAALRIDF